MITNADKSRKCGDAEIVSVHHPGPEGGKLALVLGPALTYRNNEDKLRGGGKRTREVEAGQKPEMRGETQRGGERRGIQRALIKLQKDFRES